MLQNPYAADLAGRDPIAAMRESISQIQSLTSRWPESDFERTYAPGKWSARLVLTHLAQTELALGHRARMALATPAYAAQGFNQDTWISQETRLGGREAVEALAAMSAMNRALFQSLSAAARATPFSHPEYGDLTVDWLIHQMAGHQIHHLKQLEAIATR